MKKMRIITALVLLFSLFSCTQDLNYPDQPKKDKNELVKSVPLQNEQLINAVTEWQNSNSDAFLKSSSMVSFDFNNLKLVSLANEASSSAVFANEIGYDPDNKIHFGIGFFPDGDEIKDVMIVKSEKLT
ncbi:hypothetical protein [Prolixibacter sp. SD074]|uniref:hypothetical protein n=1 Tax=Prolixibacter sp. SD074 TaxID=2652391 RepID=UPI00127980CE|nr:hypothetical protein [Prolixibacter sp. SD074]GET30806.1 hypothetical protein SD074_30080 [Prolixibacter sp. SD074]